MLAIYWYYYNERFIHLGVVNASESPFDPSEDLPTYTGNADDDPLERRS